MTLAVMTMWIAMELPYLDSPLRDVVRVGRIITLLYLLNAEMGDVRRVGSALLVAEFCCIVVDMALVRKV